MLKKLTLCNFQNHKAIAIPIGPLVTTIVGGSDVGKSAIIRALRWLCFNRPAGDAFIRDGSKTVTVVLEVDAATITRSKGPTSNQYKLDEQTLTAFGSGIPEEIESTLQVAQLNFQNQHDGPFWLCETPGEISRQMNNVVNLSAMDDAMARITSIVRKSGTTTEIFDGQVITATEQLESYAYLDALNSELDTLERSNNTLIRNTSEAAQISELVKQATSAAQKLKMSSDGVSEAEQIAQQASKVRETAEKCTSLQYLIDTAKVQQQLKAVDLSSWGRVCRIWDGLTTAQRAATELMDLITQTQTEKSNKARLVQESKIARRDLQEQSEGTCPLCKQPITQ